MPTTLPLTSLDETFVNLAEHTVMSVQLEVRVGGRLDGERLASALRTAVDRHPLARARLGPSTLGATRHTWEIAERADHLALAVTDDPPEQVRVRVQDRSPGLGRSPAFVATLVRDEGGDWLMLNLHHAAFDGLSGVRLLTSIARAYTGQDDPLGGPEIEPARDLRTIAGSRNARDVLARVGKVGGDVVARSGALLRVAPDGGEPDGPRQAFATLRLDGEAMRSVLARKPTGATLNDVAIAAHALTLRRWNHEHDVPTGARVSVMMPVNLRPAEWSAEVISNYASYLAIMLPATLDGDLAEAARVVSQHTGPLKRNGAAGWIVDLLDPGNKLPLVVKRGMSSMLPLVQGRFVESTVLSNLGRVTLPDFGDAGAVREVWFSPPAMGEVMALAVGVAGLAGELFVTVRSNRRVVGDEATQRYAGMLRRTLTGGS